MNHTGKLGKQQRSCTAGKLGYTGLNRYSVTSSYQAKCQNFELLIFKCIKK
ncbi:hypothetical protein HanRHA438_Chr01g0007631 [Helianthus annuus]|nr:hypothetical protein HanRHA438_Chr01g0007631 [Helianthus annuus]